MAEKQICDQYIKKIRILFPYIGKEEKNYLEKLRVTVSDYCADENITTLAALEEGFGKPEDIVHEYVSSLETDELVRRLNSRKIIKRIVFIILLVAVAAATFFAIYTYKEYKIIRDSSVYFEDVTIE